MNWRRASLLIGLSLTLLLPQFAATAQESKLTEEQQKAQAELQEKALRLLDQVIGEAQALKLPENRLRVQWQSGDLVWDRDEARARTLFSLAAAGIGEMIQALDPSDRRYNELVQTPVQLRQEMITTVARRDPQMAYNFLLATRPPAPNPPPSTAAPNSPPNSTPAAPVVPVAVNNSRQTAETNLEMSLLAQIAASDPRLALQNAEAALEKGQFPSSLTRMLAQLQEKDKDSAAKLKEKLFKKLRPETILSNSAATNLTTSLLRPGPWVPESQQAAASSSQTNQNSNNPNRALDEMAYRELLDLAIGAALTATPRPNGQPGAPVALNVVPTPASAANPAAARAEQANLQAIQNNARNLVNSMQSLLPHIDKYLPARSQVVRQKLIEMGIKPNPIVIDNELNTLMRQGSADALLQAASRGATPEMQSMLYRQAASRAIDEGNLERASQIATQYLDQRQRDSIAQSIERQKTLQSAMAGKMEESRQQLARLKTDNERITWLTQAASTVMQKKDKKLATQFLDEARNLAGPRVTNYQQFETHLRVARGYINVEPTRAFEMLASGIERLNELLAAAAVLSGFELRVFKDDEMLLQGGTQLNNMVVRYGQELAVLARNNFEQAQTAAGAFHRGEARVAARLAIARSLLSPRSENEMPVFIPPPPPPPSPVIRTEVVR